MKVKECVGCGFCCTQAPCTAALRIYGPVSVCPALEWDDVNNRYWCHLMMLPGSIGERYRKEIYAGAGCCSGLNTWRLDVKKRTVKKQDRLWDFRSSVTDEFQLFLAALGRQSLSGDAIFLAVADFQQRLLSLDYSESQANSMGKLVTHYIENNRRRFTREFMG